MGSRTSSVRAPEDTVRRWRESQGLAGKQGHRLPRLDFQKAPCPGTHPGDGNPPPGDSRMRSFISSARISEGWAEGRIRCSGKEMDQVGAGAPEGDLPVFYSSLDVFAYLSEYEGFGFPPLEALACGVPPVLLNRSSLAEVFQGLAVMAGGPGEEEIAGALRTALVDTGKRASSFSRFRAGESAVLLGRLRSRVGPAYRRNEGGVKTTAGPRTNERELSVILVNYNDRAHLPECLGSLDKALSGLNAEVILVDNRSDDGSARIWSGRPSPGYSSSTMTGMSAIPGPITSGSVSAAGSSSSF